MNISQAGLDLIKSFESYLKPLPDGRCTAYRCPAGVVTIGWGCTKGVHMGDVWTSEQAEDGLRRELASCEAAVMRLATREMTQPQFDALVSFVYNCGPGALARSSILRHFNAGRIEKAAAGFRLWNKARVRGQLTVLRGLTRRRAAEMALFLTPPAAEPEDPESPVLPVEPEMPQAVEPSAEKPGRIMVASVAGASGVASTLMADPAGSLQTAVAIRGSLTALLSGLPVGRMLVPALIVGAGLGLIAWLMRRPS